MLESVERSLEKLELKSCESSREVYLHHIMKVLEKSLYKFEHKQTKNSVRLAWGRLIVQAVSTGNRILADQELDNLTKRVEKLERGENIDQGFVEKEN